MATEQHLAVPRRFVTTALPWLVGASGLLVYLFTLNRWVPLHEHDPAHPPDRGRADGVRH